MPENKDFKRLVRARMQKTGEAYTIARLRLKRQNEPSADLAARAGMSDASVRKQTGRSWNDWVALLDAAGAAAMPHRDIARHVSSLGMPDWWSQMVTVGYERIRGLRAKGQRRDGGYEISKSRTYHVPLARLYQAFANARIRTRWLPVKIAVRTATPARTMRLTWEDGTVVAIGFTARGTAKSAVALSHLKLPDRTAAEAMKRTWTLYLDRLGELLG
ncbi:MAG: hypothetical protein U1E76_17660 [Planctomycetota bacterium]